ncbi:MAG: class I SAM-dependent methyltransferase [Candidatus Riflebacteria bacterium]|nr:class I SAM-dependent methyltransferase [Candidatus Riflebacteria bacterium]
MNETVEYYDKHAADFCDKHDAIRLDPFHKEVRANLPIGAKLLEIGCGSGRDAARALADGYDVIALDGSKGLLAEIPKRHPELENRLVFGIMPCKTDFPDEYFDGFYSVACLMHLYEKDLLPTMLELNRVTKKGGKGLVSIPSTRNDVNDDGVDDKGRTMNLMPLDIWAKHFEEAGFSVTHGEEEADKLERPGVFWVTFVLTKL